jgi:uncharacterized protein
MSSILEGGWMDFKKTGSTLLLAFLGGALFHMLHIPLPWLIGPLVSVMIGNTILTNRLGYSGHLKNGGLFFLSYVLGTSFTIETVYQVTHHLPLMLMITILTVVFSIFIAILVGYWSHLNVKDTILGSIPGGLSNMVALSEEIEGTEITTVTTFQLVRLLSVITLVPIIAAVVAEDLPNLTLELLQTEKAPLINHLVDSLTFMIIVPVITYLAFKMKMPTAVIIGPIVSTAALVIAGFKAPEFHPIILNTAQLLVGAHIGFLMVIKGSKNLKRVLVVSVIQTVCIIGFSILVGFVMPNLMDVTFLTGMLAAAPGGVAEMGVTAKQLHANVSIVTAYQLFRLFFILLVVPFVLKFLLKKIPNRQLEPRTRV